MSIICARVSSGGESDKWLESPFWVCMSGAGWIFSWLTGKKISNLNIVQRFLTFGELRLATRWC